MSRLIKRLNQVAQDAPRPIGFKAAQTVSLKPRIQLIASVAQADADNLADILAGADAGLLRISSPDSGSKALKKMCEIASDIPCGGWLSGASGKKEVEQIVKAGGDFVVIPAADTSMSVLEDNDIGKILEVGTSLSNGLLRTINEVSVDAVLAPGEAERGHSLTCHHVIVFQHLADLLDKPLLVTVPSNITASELQALWEAGVSGAVIEVGIGEPAEGLATLRKEIDRLTFAPRRKLRKAMAELPYISREADTIPEEEE